MVALQSNRGMHSGSSRLGGRERPHRCATLAYFQETDRVQHPSGRVGYQKRSRGERCPFGEHPPAMIHLRLFTVRDSARGFVQGFYDGS